MLKKHLAISQEDVPALPSIGKIIGTDFDLLIPRQFCIKSVSEICYKTPQNVNFDFVSQQTFTCSKSTIETL